MIILTDADDVLENLTEVWVQRVNEIYGTSVRQSEVLDWNVSLAFPTLTREQVYGVMLTDEEMYRRLRPLPGAHESIRQLLAEGHTVYVVTSSPMQPLRWKMDHFFRRYMPELDWSRFILTGRKDLIRGDVLVDDGVHNILGTPCPRKILVSACNNLTFDAEAHGAVRADNWDEVMTVLHGMMREM